MRKKVFSFFLALAMVLALLPTAAFAAGEDGASGLTPLTDPTDLMWDTANPGRCIWKTDGFFQNELYFKIYKEGTSKPVFETTQYYDGNASTDFSVDHFAEMCAGGDSGPWDSGRYYFTVQNHGDGIQYSDSGIVSSKDFTDGIYVYNQPAAVLDAPEQGTWNWPAAEWTNLTDPQVSNYFIEYGFSETFVDTQTNPYSIMTIGSTTGAVSGQADTWLQNKLIGENGIGYYYFRVRALSNNIEAIRNGGFSPWSAAYDLKAASEGIKDALTNLNNSATGTNVKEEVQKLNSVELENAMRTDLDGSNGTIDALAALEQKVGGPAAVAVAPEVANSFAQGDISVVGAKLNNTTDGGNDVTLNVGKADPKDIRDEMYDSAVAVNFSMTLGNVPSTQRLDVPVKITLPIPANINPDFLVILHYHADGSYEEVHTNCFEDSSGKWFASFVLTSFSDFVMTQQAGADPVDPPSSTEYAISVDTAANGTVTASAAKAAAGTQITITVTPDAGYQYKTLSVKTADGGDVAFTSESDHTYTFTMPADAGSITITAEFAAIPAPSTYTVTLPQTSAKGAVTADVTTAKAGDTVTLTVVPSANFTAAAPVVTGVSGTAVPVTAGAGNTYTFTMPAENVTVSVSFTSALTLKYTPYESMTDADKKEYYGGKLEISGLTPGAKYVVTFDNGLAIPSSGKIPRTAHVVTAGAGGTVTLSCQSGINVIVFGLSKPDGDVSKDLVELYSDNHAGVPVSSLIPGSGT